MKYGLIGEKLGHSFSAEIHGLLGKYEYELCPIHQEKVDSFMKEKSFLGINVTIPYKKTVIPYLDWISDDARLCGAVNTVVNRNGSLLGFNTDILGMEALCSFAGISLRGKEVMILGSGGTAGTAFALAKKSGAARISLVSRWGKDGALTYDMASKEKNTQILINTTPCGMMPDLDSSPISLSHFPRLEGVVDAIYNPLSTRLILEAKERGIPAAGGLYMLVAQAIRAAEFFIGEDFSHRILPIYQTILKKKQNLVLVGMPGCGKSTLGKILAESLEKEFCDTDMEVERAFGKKIPEIFSQQGEESFRLLETDAIRSVSLSGGKVIATGGGAILREENIRLLRQNGVILFLDAPLESLVATSDRPLSSNAADLKRRYEERYDLYCVAADHRIPVSRNVNENLLAIEKVLQ